MTTTTAQARYATYSRISDDRDGDEHGVTNQAGVTAALGATRGWALAGNYSDNDISATYGAPRPGYTALMAAAAAGEFTHIVVFHTSRLWRNRRERADGIETLRKAGVSVVAVKGPSLDMSTAYGRAMAGMLGEFDTMESEVKAERQALAALKRAEAGLAPGGVRPMGYTPAGEVIEAEAAVVRQIFERFNAGDSVKGIAAWLTQTGVPTRRGAAWNNTSVRTILLNPRYAGRQVYQGKVTGKTGTWQPLVPGWLFDSVGVKLADPRRRTNHHGTDRRYLGASLFVCDECGGQVHSSQAGRKPAYRCGGCRLLRNSTAVDAFILAVTRTRLARPDLRDLLAAPQGGKATAAAKTIAELRARITQTEADYDADLIDARRYRVKVDKLTGELRTAEAAQARLMAGTGPAGVLSAPDPVAAFDASPVGIQREVVRFLMTVRLKRGVRGRPAGWTRADGSPPFDPDTVEVRWRG